MGFTPGQNNGVTQRVTKQGETTRKWEMSRLYLVIWIRCGYMGYMLFYGLCGLFVVIIHNLIYIYIYIYVFLYVLSTITFQTFSGSFSRHRSLKETSIWLTDLQVSVSVQTGTFQKIANNIYIMEMPILGLMIPKKNAAVCNGITIVLYEMEGCNMAPKFKGFLPRFPRWAVYEMMLVFPFHTGHGFFHSIQVQSRGIKIVEWKMLIRRKKVFSRLASY